MIIPGQLVGTYRVIEKIGEGGGGTVYRGEDTVLERQVAIKVLHPGLASDVDLVTRFHREAVTLAKLNHRNIATIYNFLQTPPDLCFVMEFAEGETMHSMIKRHPGGISYPVAVPLFYGILSALDHAHKKGIIHRDIKPGNIMVDASCHTKVMDFGIARVLGSEPITRMGFMVGTEQYMSPEQKLGLKVDSRSDVYSLGLVFHEMLFGCAPFSASSEFELPKADPELSPKPLGKLVKEVPDTVIAAITKAFSKTPSDRFSDAGEFLRALKSVDGTTRLKQSNSGLNGDHSRINGESVTEHDTHVSTYSLQIYKVSSNGIATISNTFKLISQKKLLISGVFVLFLIVFLFSFQRNFIARVERGEESAPVGTTGEPSTSNKPSTQNSGDEQQAREGITGQTRQLLEIQEDKARIRAETQHKAEQEAKRQAEIQRKAEEMKRQAEEEAKRQVEALRKAEEVKRQAEAERQAEEEAKRQVEALRKAEEVKRQAQAQRRAEEEAKRQVEALRKAEEVKRQAEAERQAEEEAKRQVEALRKAEESKRQAEAQHQAEESKRQAEARRQAESKAKRRAAAQRQVEEKAAMRQTGIKRKAEEAELQAKAQRAERRAASQRKALEEAWRQEDAQRRIQEQEEARRAIAERRLQEEARQAEAQRKVKEETQRAVEEAGKRQAEAQRQMDAERKASRKALDESRSEVPEKARSKDNPEPDFIPPSF